MTKLLPILLEAREHAGPERRKELAQSVPESMHFGGKKVRELIVTNDNNSTTLIIAEVYRTVIEGADPAKAMREALDIIPMNSNTMRVNYGTAGVYAPQVDEAAEIPVHVQTYTPVTFTAKKWGRRPMISHEMVNDGLFDIINEEIKYVSASCENRFNHECHGALLEGSGNEIDRAGSNLGIKAVAAAIGINKEAGHIPTDMVLHPEAESLILQDVTALTANYAHPGSSDQDGNVYKVPILGLAGRTIGTTSSSSTYTYGYAANGEMGMVIYDRSRAAKIGMCEDLRVERFNDPIRDLEGMSVTIRFDCQSIVSTAATRVEY